MSHAKSIGQEKAFTILEVMMAAAVMLAGVVGMIQVITSGSMVLDMSRKQTIATQIIHSEIDKLHLSDWTTVSALPTSATAITINSSLQGVSQGFTCTRTVTTVKTNMKMITFTVQWTGNTGHPYQVSGSTYFGNNGLYVTYRKS
jgi:Tfp pilus assembly protein PilV